MLNDDRNTSGCRTGRRPHRTVDRARAWGRGCFLFSVVTAASGGCGDGGVSPADVVGIFGETGLGQGEFSYPRAIAIGPDGRVFVADKTGRVQRFDPQGRWQCQWFMPDYSAGKPTGLTVDVQGRVYAADTHYHRVIVFDGDGREIRRFGSQGRGPGQFELPTKVAIDRDGVLYVGEYGGNDRISRYTSEGQYLSSFGGPDAGAAALSRPSGLAFDENQVLWVADTCNHRVCRFDRSGKFLGTFGSLGKAPGSLSYPHDIVIGPDGTLWVCEFGNNRIQRFDRTGRSLGMWGTPGRRPGQLAYPWSMAIGSPRRLYIVDSGNNRVQIVSM